MSEYESPEIEVYGSIESVTEWGFGFWFDWEDLVDDEMHVSPKTKDKWH